MQPQAWPEPPRRTIALCMMMRLLFLCAPCAVSAATPWGSISPLLERSDEWGTTYLPTLPTSSDAATVYGSVASTHSGGYPFTSYTIEVDQHASAPSADRIIVAGSSAACNSSSPTAIKAGPSFTCAPGSCSGPGLSTDSEVCRVNAVVSGNHRYLQLGGRAGTHWAPGLAIPAWAQYVFPATPVGTSRLTVRYKLDARYRPELYGGNPCTSASAAYNCTLCTHGPWDFAQPPGIWILWSAAGRQDYVVSGPYSGFGESFDDGILVHVADAPAVLNLQPGEFPTVTFMTVSQYGAPGEVPFSSHNGCTF